MNLTQHPATPSQKEAGVLDFNSKHREEVAKMLTFEKLPAKQEVQRRAEAIAEFAHSHVGRMKVMVGGAPYLMSSLERELRTKGITPVYAFSKRTSKEKEVDGKDIKTQVFQHLGFVGGRMILLSSPGGNRRTPTTFPLIFYLSFFLF